MKVNIQSTSRSTYNQDESVITQLKHCLPIPNLSHSVMGLLPNWRVLRCLQRNISRHIGGYDLYLAVKNNMGPQGASQADQALIQRDKDDTKWELLKTFCAGGL